MMNDDNDQIFLHPKGVVMVTLLIYELFIYLFITSLIYDEIMIPTRYVLVLRGAKSRALLKNYKFDLHTARQCQICVLLTAFST